MRAVRYPRFMGEARTANLALVGAVVGYSLAGIIARQLKGVDADSTTALAFAWGTLFVVPFIGNPWLYLVAIAAGTVLAAFLVITAKSTKRAEKQLEEAEVAAGIIPVAS